MAHRVGLFRRAGRMGTIFNHPARWMICAGASSSRAHAVDRRPANGPGLRGPVGPGPGVSILDPRSRPGLHRPDRSARPRSGHPARGSSGGAPRSAELVASELRMEETASSISEDGMEASGGVIGVSPASIVGSSLPHVPGEGPEGSGPTAAILRILERGNGMSRMSVWPSIIGSASLGFGLFGGLGPFRGPAEAAALAASGAAARATLDEPEPYVSPEGGYRFRFPAEPKLAERTDKTPSGPVVIHAAACESPDGSTAYLVTYFDVPPKDVKAAGPDALLDRSVDGFAKSSGWRVTGKRPIKLGEYPGREVVGEVKAAGAPEVGYGRSRLCLAGNRLYQVMLIGPKSKADPAEFAKILDTFEVRPGARKVGRSAAAPTRSAPDAKAPESRRPRPSMPGPSPRAEVPAGARTLLKG